MSFIIDIANASEANVLTTLSLRSKKYWGYSDNFIEMCRDELTLKPDDFAHYLILVAKINGKYCGFIQLRFDEDSESGELEKLFIDPSFIGLGIGKALYDAGLEQARRLNIKELTLDADPNAENFYIKMGAITMCRTPSGSIPDRLIPKMKSTL
ncbi:GNAT family N-acetyltransferase [Providencia vermicola]|uniref:GNAT family N-acetyltransferase n=1 Tax=Providencia vermicola TaxID=333965 RepID=UPI0034DDBE72